MKNALLLSGLLALFSCLAFFWKAKEVNAVKNQLEIWKDQEGRSRAKLRVQESSFSEIMEANKHKIKFLEGEIDGLRRRGIRQVTDIGLVTTDTVLVPMKADTIYRDTVIYRLPVKHHFAYKDEWAQIDGTLSFFANNVELIYSTRDSLTIVDHSNKKGVFLDVISHNPNSTITGMTNFRLETKRKLRLSPAAFAGISNSGPVVGVGVALTYSR